MKRDKKKYTVAFWRTLAKRKRLAGVFKFKSSKHVYTYIRNVLVRDPELKEHSMYNKLNKSYKNIDFSKPYIGLKDAMDVLSDSNYFFSSFKTLRKNGTIKTHKTPKKVYVDVKDIEMEMLRREACCYKDDLLFEKEARAKQHRKYTRYFKQKEDIYIDFMGKRRYVGSFQRCKMSLVKRGIDFLFKHKDIFDENDRSKVHPRYARYLVTRCMNNRMNEEKINDFIKTYSKK